MSEREHYPAGVPCWTVVLQDDPRDGAAFYRELFGWELVDADGGFVLAKLRGREVAGIAPREGADPPPPATWMTHVRVDSAADAAERAPAAGGSVLAGPMDMAPAGRVTVLADPAGAALCAWEAIGREGAQLVNEPGAWSMSVLRTSDPEAVAGFYETMFGWTSEPFGPPEAGLTMWRLDGYVGGTPEQPVSRDVVAAMVLDPAAEQADWNVDFWVDAADATAERAAELGGSVVAAPHDAPPFRRAVLADRYGATFSISQLVV
jgi:predicted enzyme related to lactoylglutathione lyase